MASGLSSSRFTFLLWVSLPGLWFYLWGPQWTSQVVLVVKNLPASLGDTRDAGSIPGSGRSPGGGHGNPLQSSCLENPMDRGAWWATVRGVTKSRIRVKQLSEVSEDFLHWPHLPTDLHRLCLWPWLDDSVNIKLTDTCLSSSRLILFLGLFGSRVQHYYLYILFWTIGGQHCSQINGHKRSQQCVDIHPSFCWGSLAGRHSVVSQGNFYCLETKRVSWGMEQTHTNKANHSCCCLVTKLCPTFLRPHGL